jgi:hypothetical protein
LNIFFGQGYLFVVLRRVLFAFDEHLCRAEPFGQFDLHAVLVLHRKFADVALIHFECVISRKKSCVSPICHDPESPSVQNYLGTLRVRNLNRIVKTSGSEAVSKTGNLSAPSGCLESGKTLFWTPCSIDTEGWASELGEG